MPTQPDIEQVEFESLEGKEGNTTLSLNASDGHLRCIAKIGDSVAVLQDAREGLIKQFTLTLKKGEHTAQSQTAIISGYREGDQWRIWQRGDVASIEGLTNHMVVQPGIWRVADVQLQRTNPLARVSSERGEGRGIATDKVRDHPPRQGH